MNHPRGSLWRRWDLHVHTPASLTRPYGGNTDAAWTRFLDELENLPREFAVIGVNDYIFIDGYRRLLEEKDRGRLKNIEMLLPVIELRLGIFGGTAGDLSKINYHVIFSDEINPEVIQQHFLNALPNKYILNPIHSSLAGTWQALATTESLEDLGKRIIESVPREKRAQYKSPLVEGFNNITFQLGGIADVLDSHYFEGKYLTAVGKTEWWNIKWNDQSIADKKNLINSAHLVFISAPTPEDWLKAQEALRSAGVNHRLLDCSDAHYFPEEIQKDRIGNCYTWVKADPTFDGLKMAVVEFQNRVFVGDVPEKLNKVRLGPTKYMRSISITKATDATIDEDWFDCKIDLNPDLIAVIGNKGSGKSALVDIIGLLGNSKQDAHFSFLNEDKFRQLRENKAKNFIGALIWESDKIDRRRLDATIAPEDVETIKYIPQSYLEVICNESALTTNETMFDRELKAVIFSHIETADRLGEESLDAILARRTREAHQTIEILKGDLRRINRDIVTLEEQSTPEHRKGLENLLAAKRLELEAHEKGRPEDVPEPATDPITQATTAKLKEDISRAKDELSALMVQIQDAQKQQIELASTLLIAEGLLDKLGNFRRQYEVFLDDCEGDLQKLGIPIAEVVQLQLNEVPILSKHREMSDRKQAIDGILDVAMADSPARKRTNLEKGIRDLQGALDEPNKKYQEYLSAVSRWENIRSRLVGNQQTPDTVRYFEYQIEQLALLPEKMARATSERQTKTIEIFRQLKQLAGKYADLYRPVQRFIETHPLAQKSLQLQFNVSIVDEGFASRFLSYIDQRTTGSFSGVLEGEQAVRHLLSRTDFNDEDQTLAFIDDIIDRLTHDRRPDRGEPARIRDQLMTGRLTEALYNYIFSMEYLGPKYTLRMGGKELHELSPGERGMLLLIFYLLVDRQEIPMIIDQPEENLDNQTVYEVLVPAIREAKQRRQMVIVTHNPNLAVGCDAEQIIYAFHDIKAKHKITYTPGSIEDLIINRRIVDVLEGTRPAFDQRESKYLDT